MTKLNWDVIGERFYETGVDRGVIYPNIGPGLAWSGLISVQDTASDVSETQTYFEAMKSNNLRREHSFTATVEAYTYPYEFENEPFNLTYRTRIGNDIFGSDYGYRIHLVFNALASPSDRNYTTLNSSIDTTTFSWDITTSPIFFGERLISHLMVDTRFSAPEALQALEDLLYGTDDAEPHFPTIDELIDLFNNHSMFVIIDHGDGTWSAIGPPNMIQMIDEDTFQIDSPSANYIDSDTYEISSL